MAVDWTAEAIAKLNDAQLRELITNHVRLDATDRPSYQLAHEEMRRRNAGMLDPEKIITALVEAAKNRRTISYGELVDACGADWNQARFNLNNELAYVNDLGHKRYAVFLSTICTNKAGQVEESAVNGFLAYLDEKGVSNSGGKSALIACREKVFERFGN